MTHVILPGDINAAIGPDGVAEALKERWLVPDTDSGYLCATNDLAKIEEMRKLAEIEPEKYKPEAIPVTESHDPCLMHSRRRHVIQEIAAPMTGKDSPGLSAIAQPPQSAPIAPVPAPAPAAPAPAPQAPPAGQAQGGAGIGMPITVSRGGMSASGVIEKLLPDGRFQVGFANGQQGKPPGDNIYSKEEVSTVPGAPTR